MKSSPSMRYFPLYASIDLCNAARSATPNRRIVVWPVKHHAADDLDTRAQCDWVGRKPAGRVHGAEHIFFAANKSNIERIPRNAGARATEPSSDGICCGPQREPSHRFTAEARFGRLRASG